ncbi:MAG: hypothetical protein Q4E43_04555 [Akkermansia sp.]|nr:hypothetical protein [Akkermansia sp.]
MSTMEKERPWWVALLFLLAAMAAVLGGLILMFRLVIGQAP